MQRLEYEDSGLTPAYFPEDNISKRRPGRESVPTRDVFSAVLWILNTGALSHMLPQSYPNYGTAHQRFQRCCEQQVLRQILTDWPTRYTTQAASTSAKPSPTRAPLGLRAKG
ncbi:MAG: transposase [Burkholderiaceae bacterium]|nr:transposase [Burkholderiaceae bacterium]